MKNLSNRDSASTHKQISKELLSIAKEVFKADLLPYLSGNINNNKVDEATQTSNNNKTDETTQTSDNNKMNEVTQTSNNNKMDKATQTSDNNKTDETTQTSDNNKIDEATQTLDDNKIDKVTQTSKGGSSISKVDVSSQYPEYLNPFRQTLDGIELSRSDLVELEKFASQIIAARDLDTLSKIIDMILESGIRINAHVEDQFSLSNMVILQTHLLEDKTDKQRNIMKRLILRGAIFDYDLIKSNIITYNFYKEAQEEVKLQVDNQLREVRKIGENSAVKGTVLDVEMDNRTFYIEFSQTSVVDIAKVVEGTNDIVCNAETPRPVKPADNIVKIGNSELEIETGKNGKRNYLDISDNSSFTITFDTSLGKLNVRVYHDGENYQDVQVKVEEQKMWDALQRSREIVGGNCLFGGISVKEAIEKGRFERSGVWGKKMTETIKATTNNCTKMANETLWVNKVGHTKSHYTPGK